MYAEKLTEPDSSVLRIELNTTIIFVKRKNTTEQTINMFATVQRFRVIVTNLRWKRRLTAKG